MVYQMWILMGLLAGQLAQNFWEVEAARAEEAEAREMDPGQAIQEI